MNTRKFRKVMLGVGSHHSPQGEISVSRERLQHWADSFQQMKKNGLVVPMHYDHSTERSQLEPITLSDYSGQKKRSARNSVGKMTNVTVSEAGDSAVIEYEVTDKKAADQLESNTVYLSPVILPSFKDGQANEYSDILSHLDVVNYPVDHNQGDSEVIAMSCGIRNSDSVTVYRLAMDPDEQKKDQQPQDDQTPPTAKEDPTERESTTDEDQMQDTTTGPVTVGDILPKLDTIGLPLPQDTNGDNILDRLNVALDVAIKAASEDDMSEPQSSQDTQVVDPKPQAMSAEQQATTAYATQMHRDNIAAKLSLCLEEGRCTKEQYEKREKQLPAIKLSLNEDGQPERSSIEDFLDDCESVPKGSFWSEDERKKREKAEDIPKLSAYQSTDPNEWTEEDEAALKRIVS